MRGGNIEKGLSGTSLNLSGFLVRHQDQEDTVEEGTQERKKLAF